MQRAHRPVVIHTLLVSRLAVDLVRMASALCR
ncbi:putative leader peptide [Streptacidiphilus sp. P02-A3a]